MNDLNDVKVVYETLGDYKDWQLDMAYILEVVHENRQQLCISAMTASEEGEPEETVCVLKKHHLKKVWDCIAKRDATVRDFPAAINIEKRVAYDLRSFNLNSKPMRIFTEEKIEAICLKRFPFVWMPGLICSLQNPRIEPIF